ncbi:methyl-CpG-binding domain protein 4-like [Pollicipes pollicipes]|uniref:methyl-CpG-binding domain protein 4-like n=1 Tax=Pollicipes pollicipes TaxID=41117 RepID=UPI001884A66C|nr:methyl-CpG-binding domain protein 4-like [Pollicipes pollicipes]
MSEATPRKPNTADGVYFDDPELPEGWTRKCVQRSTGQSAGKWDVYVYNPMGRKFRSQNEVRRYLEQIGSELCPDLFSFNPYAQAGTPGGRRRTPAAAAVNPKLPVAKPKVSIAKPKVSVTKLTAKKVLERGKAVKARRGRPPGSGAGAGADAKPKMKLKFDFAKRRGPVPGGTRRPVGRPPGRPPGPRAIKPPPPPAPAPPAPRPTPPAPRAEPPAPKATPPAPKPTPPATKPRPPAQRPTPTVHRQGTPGRKPGTRPPASSAAAHKGVSAPTRRHWVPPQSPYELVQEKYFKDPWKLLIGTIFLSKPSDASPDDVWGDPPPVLECRRARPLLEAFFQRWPTAKAARAAAPAEVQQVIEPLQLGDQAAQLIIRFSDDYVSKKWKSPRELHGIGRYGSDAYKIFCLGQWKQVRPLDHMLNLYHNWLWTNYKALRLD